MLSNAQKDQAQWREWLERMRPDHARDLLYAVMVQSPSLMRHEDAVLTATFVATTPLIALISLLTAFADGSRPVLRAFLVLPLAIGMGYFLLFYLGRRKVALCAALALAERGDDRALTVLIPHWEVGLSRQRDSLEKTEETLSQLLVSIAGRGDSGQSLHEPYRATTDLMHLLQSVHRSSRVRKQADLSDRQTDLLIAALQIVIVRATFADRSFLSRFLVGRGGGKNRDLVREVAAALVNPDAITKNIAARIVALAPTNVVAIPVADKEQRIVPGRNG